MERGNYSTLPETRARGSAPRIDLPALGLPRTARYGNLPFYRRIYSYILWKLMHLTVSVGTYTRLSAVLIVPNPQQSLFSVTRRVLLLVIWITRDCSSFSYNRVVHSPHPHYLHRSAFQCCLKLSPRLTPFSFVLERHLTNLHSLGPQTNPVGLHRRPTRHRDLVQSRFGDVNHLWHLLR